MIQNNKKTTNFIFKFLEFLEKGLAFFQGKGYGEASIKQEVKLALQKTNKHPKLVIDIGGNVGNYTKNLRMRNLDSEIHIFEPSKANLLKLKIAFENDPLVIVNHCGISNVECDSILFSDEEGSGFGSLTKRRLDHFGIEFNVSEAIRLIRFDDYWRDKLNSRSIDLVKLDIEGHELEALESFGPALLVTKVIQFEFGGCNIDTKTYFQDFWYFFKENKFDLYRITPFGLNPIRKYSEIDECFRTTNYIAVNQF